MTVQPKLMIPGPAYDGTERLPFYTIYGSQRAYARTTPPSRHWTRVRDDALDAYVERYANREGFTDMQTYQAHGGMTLTVEQDGKPMHINFTTTSIAERRQLLPKAKKARR